MESRYVVNMQSVDILKCKATDNLHLQNSAAAGLCGVSESRASLFAQALKPQAPKSLKLKSRDVISAAPPFIRRLRATTFIQL